jgi:hypothetical protein
MHSLGTTRLDPSPDGPARPIGKHAAPVPHYGSKSRPTLHLCAPVPNLSQRIRTRSRVRKHAVTGALRTSPGAGQGTRSEAIDRLR